MEDFNGREEPGKPKMVVLAGPNGSGKSTVTRGLQQSDQFPDNYVNADDIAKILEKPIPDRETRERYAAIIAPNMPDLPWYGQVWNLGSRLSEETIASHLEAGEGRTDLRNAFAAILADDQRKESLRGGGDFAFETVMSTQGKLAMFDEARAKGYDVDMVFVTTESSEINKQRVLNRVQEGGHAVDPGKIVERYDRAMNMLPAALAMVDTASVYDNSFREQALIVRKENGRIEYPEVRMANAEEQESVREFQATIRGQVQAREQDFNNLNRDYNRSGKPFEHASIEPGSESYGRIVAITPQHVLQFDREKEQYVAHDRTLMTPGVIPTLQKSLEEGRDVTLAYNYGADSKLTDQAKTLDKTLIGNKELDQYLFNRDEREPPSPSSPSVGGGR